MNYIKKILKVVFFPVLFLTGEFFINYIFVAIFNSRNLIKYRDLFPDLNDIEIINTHEYKTALNNYLNNRALLMVVVTFIIFGIIFNSIIRKMKLEKSKTNMDRYNLINIFVLGVFIAIFFNTFIYTLNGVVHITDSYKVSSLPLMVTIISSGIIGPILEELLFRGIVYNKLLEFNNHKKSCIITSVMFSIIHFPNLITMIYTLILSFIMIYLYDKYKTLNAPIIFHIGINTTMNVLIYLLVKNNILVNSLLILVSLFGIVAVMNLFRKDKIADR